MPAARPAPRLNPACVAQRARPPHLLAGVHMVNSRSSARRRMDTSPSRRQAMIVFWWRSTAGGWRGARWARARACGSLRSLDADCTLCHATRACARPPPLRPATSRLPGAATCRQRPACSPVSTTAGTSARRARFSSARYLRLGSRTCLWVRNKRSAAATAATAQQRRCRAAHGSSSTAELSSAAAARAHRQELSQHGHAQGAQLRLVQRDGHRHRLKHDGVHRVVLVHVLDLLRACAW